MASVIKRFDILNSHQSNLENGYKLIPGFLTQEQLTPVYHDIETATLAAKSGGIRNAEKKFNAINVLAKSEYLKQQAQKYLTGNPSLVRAILFNKTATNNWFVTWHQDRTVAISEKFDNDLWGAWSIKDGVNHVQPPLAVLNEMVSIRIHLDDTDQRNGCLKVLPNSHHLGVLEQSDIREYVQNNKPIFCEAKAGSALIMRPHILHASSKATKVSPRRVLHLEYSRFNLPEGFFWA